MSPIKHFILSYEALNEEETFTQGDTIRGTVSFHLTKDTKVKSLVVKVKGDADVTWFGGSGRDMTFIAHKRYLKVTENLTGGNVHETKLPKGSHNFKFHLRIPEEDMPPTFMGTNGNIVYLVEAKICRSWRWPCVVHKEIKFVPKYFPVMSQVTFQCGQSGSVKSKRGAFPKGHVEMFVSVNRKACCPGDTLSVVAKVSNSLSKKTRPNFSLQQKTVYAASSETITCDVSIFKMVGETIASNCEVTVPCEVQIPADAICSLLNCELISVEYYLKVFLDISFGFDTEVILPLLVVPPSVGNLQLGAMAPGYGTYPAPAPFLASSQRPQASAPDPNQHGDFYSPWPPAVTPSCFASPVSTLAPHPAATDRLNFQHAEPPPYSSLYLLPHDPPRGGGAVPES